MVKYQTIEVTTFFLMLVLVRPIIDLIVKFSASSSKSKKKYIT